jgi:O-antigen/teichoic acid export membrane protein
LSETPAHLRGRIVAGMRWTLWLSVLAAPFSYGTTMLLARAGPEVIGTYGLLMVYIGVVSSLFYLGGDPVPIKFIPDLSRDQQWPFLASYFVILLATLIPWLGLAAAWPHSLHFVFGNQGSSSFPFLALCLSPIYLFFALVVAGLKAELDMRWAQLMLRTVTLGTFFTYVGLFVGLRRLLVLHSTGVIWGVYLALTTLASVVGFHHLRRLTAWRPQWRSLRMFLPRGFWKYTLVTQGVSVLNFLHQRLDLILVLYFGGLAVLGKYVAIISLAGLIPAGSVFFLDTLLPSLSNILARRNYAAASQIFSMNLRTSFLVTLAGASGLIFVVNPLVHLLGPEYESLTSLFVVAVLLYGLSSPGAIGGTLLTSESKQHRSVFVGLVRLGLFLPLFYRLWPKYQLAAAVWAAGLSLVISALLHITAARYGSEVKFSFLKDYLVFGLVLITAAALDLRLVRLGWAYPILTWPALILLFCALGGYRMPECRAIIRCFVPGRLTNGTPHWRAADGRLETEGP